MPRPDLCYDLFVFQNERQRRITCTRSGRSLVTSSDVSGCERQGAITARSGVACQTCLDPGGTFGTQIYQLAIAVHQSDTNAFCGISALEFQNLFTVNKAGPAIDGWLEEHGNLGTSVAINFQIEVFSGLAASARRRVGAHVFD